MQTLRNLNHLTTISAGAAIECSIQSGSCILHICHFNVFIFHRDPAFRIAYSYFVAVLAKGLLSPLLAIVEIQL